MQSYSILPSPGNEIGRCEGTQWLPVKQKLDPARQRCARAVRGIVMRCDRNGGVAEWATDSITSGYGAPWASNSAPRNLRLSLALSDNAFLVANRNCSR